LESLVDFGLVVKKQIPGQRGFHYFPTESCQELLPVIRSLADWGLRWARTNLREQDYDVELLMLYLKRSILPEKLVGKETVIHFTFTDIKSLSRWWIVVRDGEVDLCVRDPGKGVDVWFTTTVKTMVEIWMGDTTYRQAIKAGALKLVGNSSLTRNVTDWMRNSDYADLPAATRI
jgi:alkyl sulfatase BDS1-like metallo-beta-lactamase superfamily hydrolase